MVRMHQNWEAELPDKTHITSCKFLRFNKEKYKLNKDSADSDLWVHSKMLIDLPRQVYLFNINLFDINIFDFSRLDFIRFPKEGSNKDLAYIRIEPQAHQSVNFSVAGNKFPV